MKREPLELAVVAPTCKKGGSLYNTEYGGCPSCETVHIRDENAAINGIRKIIQELKNYEGVNPLSVPGSGLFCINKRWAWSVMPSRVFKTLRGQNSNENLQLQEIQFEGVVALSQNLSI